jgi:hypothetical protein
VGVARPSYALKAPQYNTQYKTTQYVRNSKYVRAERSACELAAVLASDIVTDFGASRASLYYGTLSLSTSRVEVGSQVAVSLLYYVKGINVRIIFYIVLFIIFYFGIPFSYQHE